MRNRTSRPLRQAGQCVGPAGCHDAPHRGQNSPNSRPRGRRTVNHALTYCREGSTSPSVSNTYGTSLPCRTVDIGGVLRFGHIVKPVAPARRADALLGLHHHIAHGGERHIPAHLPSQLFIAFHARIEQLDQPQTSAAPGGASEFVRRDRCQTPPLRSPRRCWSQS